MLISILLGSNLYGYSFDINKLELEKVVLKNNSKKNLSIAATTSHQCSLCKDSYQLRKQIQLPPSRTTTIESPSLIQFGTNNTISALQKQLDGEWIAHIGSQKSHEFPVDIDFYEAMFFYEDLENEYFPEKKIPPNLAPCSPDLLCHRHDEHYLAPFNISTKDILQVIQSLYKKNNLYKTSLNKNKSYKIPPIIHFIWFGSPLPRTFRQLQKEWKKKHPKWTIINWTEELLKKEFPHGLQNQRYFDHGKSVKNFAKMADVARYEIVERFGGVYADVDIKCHDSFDILHKGYDFFAGLEQFPYPAFIGNSIFGSVPGHPIMRECIEKIGKSDINRTDIVLTTGPGLVSRAVHNKAFDGNYTNLILPSIFLYDDTPAFRPANLPPRIHSFTEQIGTTSNWFGTHNPK